MLDELVGGPAAALTAVALVVAPGARASGWGAQAAAELAQRWRGPRRVLLADLDIERPSLHDAAGVPNDEGVIDLIEYGISLGRLIQSARGGAYDFIPAGMFTPEPGAILRHEGWSRVLLEVAARRGTLLAWVPADADGIEAVVERAGAVLVLADDADEGRAVVERLPHPYAVLAVLVPEAAAIPDSAEEADAAPDASDTMAAVAATDLVADDASAADTDTLAEDDRPADADTLAEDDRPADADTLAEDDRPADADMPAEDDRPADADMLAEQARGAEADAREEAVAAGAADTISVDAPPATADLAADTESPPQAVSPADIASQADADLLEHDPAAREALAEEIRERQRAARIAGAAAAAGLFGGANAAGEAPALTGAGHGDLDGSKARGFDADGDSAETDVARDEVASDDGVETADPYSDADVLADARSDAVGHAADSSNAVRATADLPDPDGAMADADLPIASQAAEPSAAELAMADPVTGSPVPVPAGPQTDDPEPAPRQRVGAAASPPLRKPPRRKFSHPLVWTVGVVLLMSLLAGAWHFLGGRLPRLEPPVAAPVTEPEPPPAPIAQNALPFVVAIEAHREITAALTRVTDLTEIEPGLLFHIESVERDGTLFYHVMAGPVADSATALALRDTLITRGHKTGATPTDVRATPLAFLIGDYGTRTAATEQGEVLRRLDIPGYVLQGEAADGQPLYRLYVGGFATEAESDVVGQMLRAAGIRDSLVTRTGSRAAAAPFGLPGDSVTAGDSLVTPTDSSNP